VVALFHPHGTLAPVAPPEELLAAPADDYVAGFVGFDRGIRRLSFVPTAALELSSGPVLPADATVAKARAAGQPWILITEIRGGGARGWVNAARLGALPDDTPLGQVATEGLGHSFAVDTDSLRAALDAAVLSPAGQAVGVDGAGRVLGVAGFDQLRAAIAAADSRRRPGQRDTGQGGWRP
jgi:osmoprotectant transport system ATP-binding protein